MVGYSYIFRKAGTELRMAVTGRSFKKLVSKIPFNICVDAANVVT